jgi:hypothetical protein
MSKSVKTSRLESSQSLAADFQTDWLTISYQDNVGYLITTSGVTDNLGTFAVEVRMTDSNGNSSNGVPLTLDSVPTLNDTDAEFFINLNQVPATQVRLTFTAAGGTPDGSAAIFVHSKSVGA